ncbi:MAG: glycerol-3-phosphate dehydrogenase/oxidase [Desulfobacterales bacterium]|nr:glycerol-3-phosphate dehydrogenase/oxidase [Desulfobacterales bacterium]
MNIDSIGKEWDLIVIGGGITGAGILREAVRYGLRTLLLEKNDFAWGTSSRSSKLVHGGLRYLKQGRFLLTRTAVKEREALLREAPGLVESLKFCVPVFSGQRPGKWALETGLTMYDLIAGKKQHRFEDKTVFSGSIPGIRIDGLTGGFSFFDARSDDTRLVMRLINDAVAHGGWALNYTRAAAIERDRQGRVTGVRAEDTETGQGRNLAARAVINATGAWVETLHGPPEKGYRLRPLRGSHLVFPADKLPVPCGISYMHPEDNRAVFIVPWEGAVLAGTTDLDHTEDLDNEPRISRVEARYLMQGIHTLFPDLHISLQDCRASFAGVRPVLSRGNRAPSSESREHLIWINDGLVSVTGGKLTTFRKLAWDALMAARPFLPDFSTGSRPPAFEKIPVPEARPDSPMTSDALRRLYGRYGMAARQITEKAVTGDLERIPGTRSVWAELPYVAARESVRHLEDILLRRVRLGILLDDGGLQVITRIRRLLAPVLKWDDNRWSLEIERYRKLWKRCYAPPEE